MNVCTANYKDPKKTDQKSLNCFFKLLISFHNYKVFSRNAKGEASLK